MGPLRGAARPGLFLGLAIAGGVTLEDLGTALGQALLIASLGFLLAAPFPVGAMTPRERGAE